MPGCSPDASVQVALEYHERTEHHLRRYARSLGYLDWRTQPDPFRRFEGAPRLRLDQVPAGAEPTYDSLFGRTGAEPRPLDRASLSQLFQDSLALSAWKEQGGSRWSLRVNPSSGNLHPTEGYLVGGPFAGLEGGPAQYHYAPDEHALERLRPLPAEAWRELSRDLPRASFLVGLTSIYWRESWKYGERAFRYCLLDLGHALAALSIAAAALGWQTCLAETWTDEEVGRLLGVDRQSGIEAEHAQALLVVWPRGAEWAPERRSGWRPSAPALEAIGALELAGRPNRLSPSHQPWSIIEEASRATRRIEPAPGPPWHPSPPPATPGPAPDRGIPARRVIHQRRSAIDLDGVTSIRSEDFFRMLERTLPHANPTVFGGLPWTPSVHLALFVHRVEGLAPGLYLLLREAAAGAELREAIARPELEWSRVEEAPNAVALFRLAAGDLRQTAELVSCHQEIAADGAYAAAMLARFEPVLSEQGAWTYRRLHWEAGAVGQMLYLEAEAAGVRGTGMGCFFDDAIHGVLGLADRSFQSLYHFVVGGPVEDPRLRTEPPYASRG